jgi:hypothetical protein
MEKIFEEERKEQEEKERIDKEMNPNVSSFSIFSPFSYSFYSEKDSNLFLWFSILFIIFSLSCLGYQYFGFNFSFGFKNQGPSISR